MNAYEATTKVRNGVHTSVRRYSDRNTRLSTFNATYATYTTSLDEPKTSLMQVLKEPSPRPLPRR